MKIEIYKDLSAEVLPTPGNSKHSTLFIFQTLKAGDINMTDSTQIYSFVELINAFVSNHLHTEKKYKLDYKGIRGTKGGYVAEIVTQQNQYFLRVEISDKKYYFEKYECRVIARVINSILSKCTFSELTGYERQCK